MHIGVLDDINMTTVFATTIPTITITYMKLLTLYLSNQLAYRVHGYIIHDV